MRRTAKSIISATVSTLALGLWTGCAAGDPVEDTAPRDLELTSEDRVGTEEAADEVINDEIVQEECKELELRAEALLGWSQVCEPGGACMLLDFTKQDTCMLPLQCYVPISSNANMDAVMSKVLELDRQYRESCGPCVEAQFCEERQEVRAGCEDGECTVMHVPVGDWR